MLTLSHGLGFYSSKYSLHGTGFIVTNKLRNLSESVLLILNVILVLVFISNNSANLKLSIYQSFSERCIYELLDLSHQLLKIITYSVPTVTYQLIIDEAYKSQKVFLFEDLKS